MCEYNFYLKKLDGFKKISFQSSNINSEINHSYFPVIFESEGVLLKVVRKLEENKIFPRRYFYPLLSDLSYVEKPQNLSIAKSVSKRVICLPMYFGISEMDLCRITEIIINQINEQ